MRFTLTAAVCALGLFAFSAIGSSAAALPPAVDQYTEQFPSPGGSEEVGDNGANATGNQSGSRGSNNGSTGSGSSTSSDDPSGAASGTDGKTNTDGQANRSGKSGQAGGEGLNGGSANPGSSERSSDAQPQVQSSSVGGSADGMGWLFPFLLVSAAVAFGGFAIYRRRGKGSAGL